MKHNKIDFVILWVDGNDPKWQEALSKYSKTPKNNKHYRDWDNLHYIFRAFEVFTPWVNKIHFITWGHLPKWLNTDHPKLNIRNHTDFLDKKNLPVFNSNAIEPSIYRIKGLSEKFVLFNDDLFITKPIPKERFFQNNLPCDSLIFNALSSSSGVGHFVLNNLEILNKHFNKRAFLKHHFGKWFNPLYGKELLRNIALLPWSRFTGFVDWHMPQPFLKSTFEEIWEKERAVLEQTSASKFRNCNDLNQYLFRYWQLAKGDFVPVSMNDTKYITMTMQNLRNGEVERAIVSGKYALVCLNDSEKIATEEEFTEAKKIVQEAFEKILPEKSAFEV